LCYWSVEPITAIINKKVKNQERFFTFFICNTTIQEAGINFLFKQEKSLPMRDWLRTLIAGYGAYKWGGGCLGTIVVFVIIYWALGHC